MDLCTKLRRTQSYHMAVRSAFYCLLCVLCSFTGVAQTSLPIPLNIRAAITNGTRTATGQPGAKYWQNRADYSIQVRFDPHTRLFIRTEPIPYAHNSPHTFHHLLLQLSPNL